MIEVSNVAKAFGGRTLFERATMKLVGGSRYGLVGANGSGKTTFLRMLSGSEPLTEGSIVIPRQARVGVLEQDQFLNDEARIVNLAMMGDKPAWTALDHQRALLEAADRHDGDVEARDTSVDRAAAIADAEDRIRLTDGYTLRSRAAEVLEGLGIGASHHDQPLSTLSGGFKLRVQLAQVLLSGPDVLLLDEPTNHLDILTIRWLETFLSRYLGCAVIISHDRRFLDNVATHIVDVDYETLNLYTGNYAAFEVEKEQTRNRLEAEAERLAKILADKKAFVERFRYKASKARQAQSRLKQIEKVERDLDEQRPVRSSRRYPTFRFVQRRPSGKDVVTLDRVSKAYGTLRVLTDVSLTLRRGERAAVIGANGIGKSTLLKIIASRLEADTGTLGWGYETHPGYFPQDHGELLDDPSTTALDFLWDHCPEQPTSFVRGQLGAVLFSGEDADKKVQSLSGGESARLIFSRLMVDEPNVLLLDEPTNHLDIESIEALVKGLSRYEGTFLFVSHNRWFVAQLATRILELTEDGLNDYPGTYDDYLAHCGDDHLDADAVALQQKRSGGGTGQAAAPTAAEPIGDWELRKERKRRHKKLLGERAEVTESIDAAETRLKEIEQLYCEPGFFERTPTGEVAALETEQAALGPRIEALMARWEAIETELGDAEEP